MDTGFGNTEMHADVVHRSQFAGLAKLGFSYHLELVDPSGKVIGTQVAENLYTTEGLNHMLNVELNAQAASPSWFLGLFEGNYNPTTADTAAAISIAATESSAFAAPTQRKAWTTSAAASGGTINNYANKAAFTFTAAKLIYGGFLISSPTVNAVSGVMISVVRFGSPVSAAIGSVLNVGAGCTIISA